ncbi:BaiN/RdsA family NAD(P)/FAD-dependent oxidoreductase [Falsiroseomonas tokyonensis]|uniref:NAD(P)/FAD-dependent oxidoreductase n=1 Tax=Falsiroseomonas tokyonensis TaxID=430521 RepID=A0ABV7BV78_9PROT|nr:TIGR03862 family flavoprotein [Falsiroseomonas tokyonensis]MBU8538326.1 TIGR03862 family flavoprotein [Falsiroseomonas tokyonensis]
MNELPAPPAPPHNRVTVIGAGPAGLMAAEVLATAGLAVTVHDHMPSVGRKFLMAGRGGLNLTHGEPLELLLTRYRPAAPPLIEAVRGFPPAALIAWCEGLGVPTFAGSSARIFPTSLKSSPLLRAWLQRLAGLGVELRSRSCWIGWGPAGEPLFEGEQAAEAPAATVLALGGASWPRLGSDGHWPALLPGIRTAPWAPANMGFTVAWSDHFRDRHQGTPLKRIGLRFGAIAVRGEAMVTRTGLEGGALYALSAPLREAIAAQGSTRIELDLRPDLSEAIVAERLASRPRSESLANGLRKALALPPVAIGLVQEALRSDAAGVPPARLIKALPLRLTGTAGIERAISSAGGLAWSEVDDRLMLTARPGVFACGEMLDWEAPTGGYLLQGCFSTGVAAARGTLAWLAEQAGRS